MPSVFAATCVFVALPAHAQTHIALDLDFNTGIDTPGTDTGAGGAVRIGQELDLFLVSLTPEVGGSYHTFAGNADNQLYAGFLGARLGVGKVVEPSVFAHVGVGRLDGVASRTAPTLDAGLALDFTLLPLINFGVHGGYNVLLPGDDQDALKFVTLGIQAALVF